MKERLSKLTNNLSFIVAVVAFILFLYENKNEIQNFLKEISKKESWIKFKDDLNTAFTTFNKK